MPIPAAVAALKDARTALGELEARCCDPGRSPHLEKLALTLVDLQGQVDRWDANDNALGRLIPLLEDAGSQVGWLQIGCCAENRLPLYARILEDLTRVQMEANRSAGLGH